MNTAEQVLSRSLTLITHQHRQILLRDSEVDWVKGSQGPNSNLDLAKASENIFRAESDQKNSNFFF